MSDSKRTAFGEVSSRTCARCRTGQLEPGTTTMTIEREAAEREHTVVFKGVPALVCQQCGEAYLEGPTLDRVQEEFEAAVEGGTLTQVRYLGAGADGSAQPAAEVQHA